MGSGRHHGDRRGDLIRGDIITAIGGTSVNSPDDISTILDKHEIGDEVTVTIRRGDATHSVSLKLADED